MKGSETSRSLRDRVNGFIESIRGRQSQIERWALPAALIVFVGGLAVAVVGLDVDLANVRWPLILSVAVIGVPATILVNAGEVFLAGKFAGVALNPVSSLRLSILSTAANLMPLPGGVLVRSGDLVSRGSTGRTALRAQVSVGLLWNFMALAVLFIVALRAAPQWLWVIALGAGAFLALAFLVMPRRLLGLAGVVCGLELISLAVTALRIHWLWEAFGLVFVSSAPWAVSAANALGALVWVVPAGIGIRELIGSVLGTIVGVPASAGFTVQAVDRIVGMIVNLLIGLVMALYDRSRRAEDRGESLFE